MRRAHAAHWHVRRVACAGGRHGSPTGLRIGRGDLRVALGRESGIDQRPAARRPARRFARAQDARHPRWIIRACASLGWSWRAVETARTKHHCQPGRSLDDGVHEPGQMQISCPLPSRARLPQSVPTNPSMLARPRANAASRPVSRSRCFCRHYAQVSFIMHCIGKLMRPMPTCLGSRYGARTPGRAFCTSSRSRWQRSCAASNPRVRIQQQDAGHKPSV